MLPLFLYTALVNPHLLFYGVQWGDASDDWTVVRGRDGLTQLIPPGWSPIVEKEIAIADGDYTVEFWKGQGAFWSSNPAEKAGSHANVYKSLLLAMDTLAPPGWNLATGIVNNNDLIEWMATNPSERQDEIISIWEALNVSSADDAFSVFMKILDLMHNDGVYEGSLTQKLAQIVYDATDTDGRSLWRHFKNANTWLEKMAKVLKVYDVLNEFVPYFGQVFFYSNHYLYEINIQDGILIVGYAEIPPEAVLTASTALPFVAETVAFDASGSTDDSDPVSTLSFRFDFEADGVWDTAWAQGDATESHTYTSIGAKTCIVEVEDSLGLTSQAHYYLNVLEAGSGTIEIDVTPDTGQWRLLWPADFAPISSSGDLTITDAPVGVYTLIAYDTISGYNPPAAVSSTLAAGETITFVATWTLEGEPFDTETILLPGDVPLEMVWIEPGTFMMGRYSGEQDSSSYEDPQHQVTLTQGFWMGKYEVTKAQWTAVMGTRPWSSQSYVLDDPGSPAVYVSWNDARSFISALNTLSGKTFRLPTEAEWEYACRAGTTTRFYWGDDSSYTVGNAYAWWRYNTYDVNEKYAHVVGQKLPNDFGLFDMSGNVWEWCEDDSHSNYTGAPADGSAWTDSPRGSYRVKRGGGWSYDGSYFRSAYRSDSYRYPSSASYDIGFRLSR